MRKREIDIDSFFFSIPFPESESILFVLAIDLSFCFHLCLRDDQRSVISDQRFRKSFCQDVPEMWARVFGEDDSSNNLFESENNFLVGNLTQVDECENLKDEQAKWAKLMEEVFRRV